MQVLENERFRVEINEFGAELTRFTSKKDGTEYIWKGDPAAWKRHAPILFPIVGRLKDKTYTVDGRPYEITQHGFGRDLAWQAQKISGTCAEFTLTPSEYTKKMYPWDFICTVRYTLDGNALKKEHIVKNASDSVMYYEIGGHDAYTLCWEDGEKITDYYVEFDADRRPRFRSADRRQTADFPRAVCKRCGHDRGSAVPHSDHCQHEEPPPCDDGLHRLRLFRGVEPV